MKRDNSIRTLFLPCLIMLIVCLLSFPACAKVWVTDYSETSVTVEWDTPEGTTGVYIEEAERLSTINWDGSRRGKTLTIGELLNYTIEWGEGAYYHSGVVNSSARSYTITGLNPGTAIDVRVTYKFLFNENTSDDGKFYYGFHGTTVATTLERMVADPLPEPAQWKKVYTNGGIAWVEIPCPAPRNEDGVPGIVTGYECYIVGGPEAKINGNNEYPELRASGSYYDGILHIANSQVPVKQYGVVTVSIRTYRGYHTYRTFYGEKIWTSAWGWVRDVHYNVGGWKIERLVADSSFKVTRKKNWKQLKKNSLTVTISPVKYAISYDIYVSELTKKGKAKKWKKAATVYASDGQRVKKKITKIKGKYINPKKSYAVKVITNSRYGNSNGDNQKNVY